MKRLTFFFSLLLSYSFLYAQQVMISEVDFCDTEVRVELYNSGSEINISSWQFCNRPSYSRLDAAAVTLISGSLVMPAGSYTVLSWNQFNKTGAGEIGLYSAGAFGNSDFLVDYVQYGGVRASSRASVAVSAGVWANVNDFVPYPTCPNSIGIYSADTIPENTDIADWCQMMQTLNSANSASCVCDVEAGDLVITEIMQNPSAVLDSNGEWFEVYNASSGAVNLNGLTLKDDGIDSHVIDTNVIVAAGAYAVLGRNGDSGVNGGVSVDYEYSSFLLSNSADEIIIQCGSLTIDSVGYDGGTNFPDPNGASMSFDPSLLDGSNDTVENDMGDNWCEATSAYGDGDLGTPGSANDACGNGNCPEDLDFVDQNLTTETYQVSDTISASGTTQVLVGETVIFDAGTSITLKPDFSVPNGATFTAMINGCTPALAISPQEVESRQVKIEPLDLSVAPNPLETHATISYYIPREEMINITVYNLNGTRVMQLIDNQLQSGQQQLTFDGHLLTAGVYVIILRTKDEVLTKKISIAK